MIDVTGPQSADDILDALDPEQREVAANPSGPMVVLAGAGTGKTRAITHRIAYGVRSGAYQPQRVLAVTFTARAAGDAWTLTVADEGPGLTPERAERLFHRFGPGGDEGGGTGLGLAIAAWVASMHGGTIRALGADAGARLELHLPLTPPAFPSPAPLTTTTTQEPTMTAESAPSLRGSAANGLAPGPEEARQRRLEGQGTGLSLSRWWPERVTQGQPRLLLAALAVGLLAAILLPGNAIGLGLLVVLTAGGAALWLASPRRAKPWSWVTAALALPLGLTTILRDDPVMSFFAVAVAGVLAATACTDARTVGGIAASVIALSLIHI